MALTMKSVDTMKTSRDSGSITNAQKVAHINKIVQLIPDLTHIAIGCYGNNFGYHSVAYIKEWFDAVHNTGKKVFFRPALASFSPNTAAGLTDAMVQEVTDLATCWENGDYWDVVPESNPLSVLFTNVAGWNTWVRDTITALDTAFTTLGKTVEHTFFSGTDQTTIFNARIEAETVTAMGNKICIDFYPMDVGTTRSKVANLINQIGSAHANYPTADVYITETGYNNTTLVGDENQREVIRHFLNEIQNVSYIKGLNYWHVAGNTEFDKCLIFEDDSLVNPRPAVSVLSESYTKNICNGRLKILP